MYFISDGSRKTEEIRSNSYFCLLTGLLGYFKMAFQNKPTVFFPAQICHQGTKPYPYKVTEVPRSSTKSSLFYSSGNRDTVIGYFGKDKEIQHQSLQNQQWSDGYENRLLHHCPLALHPKFSVIPFSPVRAQPFRATKLELRLCIYT